MADGEDPSPDAGLALRLETNVASKRASQAGCVPLVFAAVLALPVGVGLYYLGWPQAGIIADLSRPGPKVGTDTTDGSIIVAIALASGVIPAFLAMEAVGWIADRRRFRYSIVGPLLTVTAVGVYAAWVSVIMLTPIWAFLMAIVVVPLGALVVVVLAVTWLRDWIRTQKPR